MGGPGSAGGFVGWVGVVGVGDFWWDYVEWFVLMMVEGGLLRMVLWVFVLFYIFDMCMLIVAELVYELRVSFVLISKVIGYFE